MPVSTPVLSIKRVGVVGSGIMGAGIAECVAANGHDVIVRARRRTTVEALRDNMARSLARRVDKGSLSAAERQGTLDRLTITEDLEDLADCDLVIESVIEDLATKQALFAELDAIVGDDTLLATNTSTLPVIELATRTRRPDRVCGLHFFNPAPVMGLVEVARPLTASDTTIAAAMAFVDALGKTAIEVADQAGFIVNALLFLYLNGAVRMVASGVAERDAIDAAMTGACNFPVGPLALLDLIGLDTSLAVLDALHLEFRTPEYVAAPLLRRMVAAGRLGRKSGEGFYRYG